MSFLKRPAFFAYRLVGIHLPKSSSPLLGSLSKKIRQALCSHLFKKMGHNVNVEKGALFGYGENIEIGNNSGIGINCRIPPNTIIGDDVMMGPDCVIYPANHRFDRLDIPINQQGFTPKEQTVIGNDVWIGGRVIILPGRTIANGVVVAAGSVVTKNLEAYGVYGGNPAKLLKSRKE